MPRLAFAVSSWALAKFHEELTSGTDLNYEPYLDERGPLAVSLVPLMVWRPDTGSHLSAVLHCRWRAGRDDAGPAADPIPFSSSDPTSAKPIKYELNPQLFR